MTNPSNHALPFYPVICYIVVTQKWAFEIQQKQQLANGKGE
jgi:hypothetical protein